MKLSEIVQAIDAEVLCCEDRVREIDIQTAYASDLMSDVLAYVKDQAVLVTGLNNPQVVRTADMMDMICIVFVRGKSPSAEAAAMACELDIPLFSTPHTLFQACGILYAQGMAPCPPLAGKCLEE